MVIFAPPTAAADLVLPAAAGGQRLLQPQHVVEQLALVERAAHHALDHRQDDRADDARGAQPAALGNADQRGQLDAAAEFLAASRASVTPAGQSAISGEKPQIASAALARAKRRSGRR